MTLGRRVAAVAAALVAAVTVVLGAGLVVSPAGAHSPASSLVKVALLDDATDSSGPVVQVSGTVALQELDVAYGTALMQEAADRGAAATVAQHAGELRSLFGDRVTLSSTDGTAWTTTIESVSAATDQGQDAVKVVFTSTGPTAADAKEVVLRWGVVIDQVVTHDVYVGAVDAGGATTLVATLTRAHPTTMLTVDEPRASSSMWSVGWHHFRGGADHLLFLGLVALAAARRRGRWATILRRLGVLTLTFTVGHSISLALASSGLVSVPTRWVEVAIAATIVVAAAHAARPRLSLRTEVIITAVFGLIHGFGFAGTLQEESLRGWDLAVPLLTFNLGLEAAQLVALGLVILPLLVIARSTAATWTLVCAVGLVAVSWIVQRATGAVSDPLDPVLDVVLASPERVALVLALVAATMMATTARRPTSGTSPAPAGRPAAGWGWVRSMPDREGARG